MNTILPPVLDHASRPARRTAASSGQEVRLSPRYELEPAGDKIALTVFMPGVDASGVEIVVRGPDLIVTGRKMHPLRVNFASAHLEHVQRDYELRLRLGRDFDYSGLTAQLDGGMLRIELPRRVALAQAA